MMLASLHLFEDTEARGAAENMALDEALFLQVTSPVMRSGLRFRLATSRPGDWLLNALRNETPYADGQGEE
jgi:hypothetical protein